MDGEKVEKVGNSEIEQEVRALEDTTLQEENIITEAAEEKANQEVIENHELNELTQNIQNVALSPIDENKKAYRKRRGRVLLFVLLCLVEAAMGYMFYIGVISEDLHYRSAKQIENSIRGKISFNSGTYIGKTDFGYFIEDGKFDFKSGTTYDGKWNNNQMEGIGILNVPNEGTYEGEFLESNKHGKGVFIWNDGSIYDGQWQNDQMSGNGQYISANDVIYEGTFRFNKFWLGTCTFSNDTGTYEARYKNGEIDNLKIEFCDGTKYDGAANTESLVGLGTMTFVNGDLYKGNFKKGLRNGEGSYTWSNGDMYNGVWENDTMNGSGIYTYADGSCAQGTFKNNLFIDGSYTVTNEFGEYVFTISEQEPVSVKMVLSNGTTYSGEIEDGELTGTAQIVYGNGDKYSGLVLDGYKNGRGTYTWSSGASYEGDWSKDKMHGSGVYYYADKEDGYKLTGYFANGVPDGECKYYVSASNYYKTDWSDGRCIKIYE